MNNEAVHEDLIDYISKQIDAEPTKAENYHMRGLQHLASKRYVDAIQDYNLAIELDSKNSLYYAVRAAIYAETGKYDSAIKDYDAAIALKPDAPNLYHGRGNNYFDKEDFKNAVSDYSRAIALDPNKAEYYSDRADAYSRLNKLEEAKSDYTRAINLKPSSKYDHFERGKIYHEEDNYDDALEDYSVVIQIDPENADAYFRRATIYNNLEKYDKAIEDYGKVIEIDPNFASSGFPYAKRAEAYMKIGDSINALSDLENYRAIAFYNKDMVLTPEFIDGMSEDYSYYAEDLRDRALEGMTRENERNKVIQDLSHSIKNLISTVIDPLENLRGETTVHPQTIENALRGANLIREIVNAINLSYKGAPEDFIYDAEHNKGGDAMSFNDMFLASIKQSVSNMFDGKYFNNFMRKYFPKKELYLSAKEKWSAVSKAQDINSMVPYLENYFFKSYIELENADKFTIGNEKGSAVKLLIMVQEIVLNAVKYSAFIDKEERFVRLRYSSNQSHITIEVANPFDENVRTKTTGTGHVIIGNFARLLGSEPVVKKKDGIYSVVVQFDNFWGGGVK